MDRMTMKIGGMSCGHCVSSVDKALKKLDGVQVESVAIVRPVGGLRAANHRRDC